MDLSFERKVTLVTGASSGIGLATAKAFAEAGASVVLADNNEDTLRAATDELTSAGRKATGVTCGVADEAQVAAAYGFDDEDIAAIVRETGLPSGWLPLVVGYDELPRTSDDLILPDGLDAFLQTVDRRELLAEEVVRLKTQLRLLYRAGPGRKADDATQAV